MMRLEEKVPGLKSPVLNNSRIESKGKGMKHALKMKKRRIT